MRHRLLIYALQVDGNVRLHLCFPELAHRRVATPEKAGDVRGSVPAAISNKSRNLLREHERSGFFVQSVCVCVRRAKDQDCKNDEIRVYCLQSHVNVRLIKQEIAQLNDQQWRCSPYLKDEHKEGESLWKVWMHLPMGRMPSGRPGR